MFSDLAQGALKNSMLDALAADPNFSLMAERILGMKDELPEVKAVRSFANRSGTKSSYIAFTSHSVIDCTLHPFIIRKRKKGIIVDLLN